jgi:hypothetical protein
MGWAPDFFSSPPVRREMEHRREEPPSGWAGRVLSFSPSLLQLEAVSWASKIIVTGERERERDRGEGEKEKAWRSREMFYGVLILF